VFPAFRSSISAIPLFVTGLRLQFSCVFLGKKNHHIYDDESFPCFFMLLQKNEKVGPFKFPIYVSNIHKGKHGSDSGVYDVNGRYLQLSSVTIHMKPSG
jgi:hypothetical protein